MAVLKKKRVAKKSVKEVPKDIYEDPPEGNLDNFFKWLNKKYGTELPRLSVCPAKFVARDLLNKMIVYEKAPVGIMYKARIYGEITVFENILLSGFVVQFEQNIDSQPKNYQSPIIQLYGRQTRKKTNKKESCYD